MKYEVSFTKIFQAPNESQLDTVLMDYLSDCVHFGDASAFKRSPAMKVEYEVMLRYQDDNELIVDVRKDIVDEWGNPGYQEYIEGFSYEDTLMVDRYAKALVDFKKLIAKYEKLKSPTVKVLTWDEVEYNAKELLSIKDKTKPLERHNSDGGIFYTNPDYWDCECSHNYIHKKADKKECTECGTHHESQPDSRQNEIDSYEHI
jgi:hypothetical protein